MPTSIPSHASNKVSSVGGHTRVPRVENTPGRPLPRQEHLLLLAYCYY